MAKFSDGRKILGFWRIIPQGGVAFQSAVGPPMRRPKYVIVSTQSRELLPGDSKVVKYGRRASASAVGGHG